MEKEKRKKKQSESVFMDVGDVGVSLLRKRDVPNQSSELFWIRLSATTTYLGTISMPDIDA